MSDQEARRKLIEMAGRLLARRPRSRAELRSRLAKTGSSADLESVLQSLEQHGLLNDADYAYNFVLGRLRRAGWGPARIRVYLLARGVAPELVDSALVKAGAETDERTGLADYLSRRFRRTGSPASGTEIRRLFLHLRRRGFSEGAIAAVLREMLPDRLRSGFETGE